MAKTAKGLSVTRRPNNSWRAQIRKGGYPYQSRDFPTHREADERGMARLAEMRSGDISDRRPARRTTFGNAIDRYMTEVRDKRPGEPTRAADRARLQRFKRRGKSAIVLWPT